MDGRAANCGGGPGSLGGIRQSDQRRKTLKKDRPLESHHVRLEYRHVWPYLPPVKLM